MFKKVILTVAVTAAFGAQAQTYDQAEKEHGFRFVGHVDEVCGFSEIDDNDGNIVFVNSDVSQSDRINVHKNDIKDSDWIGFKVKSNTGKNPVISISEINTEGKLGKIDNSNTTFFVKDGEKGISSSAIKSFAQLDSIMMLSTSGKPFYLGVVTSLDKPDMMGDFAIIPTVTVTCD